MVDLATIYPLVELYLYIMFDYLRSKHLFDNHYQTSVQMRMYININWKWLSMYKKS